MSHRLLNIIQNYAFLSETSELLDEDASLLSQLESCKFADVASTATTHIFFSKKTQQKEVCTRVLELLKSGGKLAFFLCYANMSCLRNCIVGDVASTGEEATPRFKHLWCSWSFDVDSEVVHVYAKRAFPSMTQHSGLEIAFESQSKGFGIRTLREFRAGEVIMPAEGVVGPLGKRKPRAGEVVSLLNQRSSSSVNAFPSRIETLCTHVYMFSTADAVIYNSTTWAGMLVNVAAQDELYNCEYVAESVGLISELSTLRLPVSGDCLGSFVATRRIASGEFVLFSYYNEPTDKALELRRQVENGTDKVALFTRKIMETARYLLP